jgi:hypothetical protein
MKSVQVVREKFFIIPTHCLTHYQTAPEVINPEDGKYNVYQNVGELPT